MSESIHWEHIADTKDTSDPVIKAEIGASFCHMILDRSNEEIRVAHINSAEKGHMKAILDRITDFLGWYDVVFLSPLDEFKRDDDKKLIDVLDGFKEGTEMHEIGEVEIYRGEWNPS